MESPACPVCRSTRTRFRLRNRDFLFRTTDRRHELFRCGDCGAGFLHPQPSDDELKAAYPSPYWWVTERPSRSLAARLESLYRETVLRHHVRVARAAMPSPPGPLLDVGCGSGTFLHVFRRRTGIAGAGLETSPDAARCARELYGIDVRAGELLETAFPESAFSLITMFHVLEHLRDPVEGLSHLRPWLVPRGRLLLQVPNLDSLQFRLFGKRWTGIDIPRHLTGFTPAALEHCLRRAGMRLVRLRYWSWRDDPAAAVSSLFPGLDPVALQIRRNIRFALPKKFLYLVLVAAATPPAWLEAASRKGATMFATAEKAD